MIRISDVDALKALIWILAFSMAFVAAMLHFLCRKAEERESLRKSMAAGIELSIESMAIAFAFMGERLTEAASANLPNVELRAKSLVAFVILIPLVIFVSLLTVGFKREVIILTENQVLGVSVGLGGFALTVAVFGI